MRSLLSNIAPKIFQIILPKQFSKSSECNEKREKQFWTGASANPTLKRPSPALQPSRPDNQGSRMLGPHQEVSYGPATANPSNGTSVSALNLDAGLDGDWPGPRHYLDN